MLNSVEQLDALNAAVLGACLGPDAMLGHSYAFALYARLRDCGDAEVDSIVLDMWRYTVVPQLIDSLRS